MNKKSLLFFLIQTIGLFSYQIVFIHLGKALPPYLFTALSQARSFNPEADLILIANGEALVDQPLENVRAIPAESIRKTSDHQIFNNISVLNRAYREGFWYYTTERLFYLNDLICQYDLKETFHLENDNMLYVDLGELLPIFQMNYRGMAVPFEQDSRGAASLVYIADQKSINGLARHLRNHARSGQSEMYLLSSFKNEFGIEFIDHLPVIIPEYGEDHTPLTDPEGRVDRLSPAHYSNHFDQFQSVFDMCSYGQYLGGIDPRNGPDGPGYINPLSIFNCSHMTFEWELDEAMRKVPFVNYNGKRCRINNLHIHSKFLEKFR